MDRVLTEYRSAMILYEGGPLVWGRWQFLPDDRPFVPFPHVFGSSTWYSRDLWDTPVSVGEQRGHSQLVRPTRLNPRLVGGTPCGEERVWQGKATAADVGTPAVDAEGVPVCCQALEWVGGVEAGGDRPDQPTLTYAGCDGVGYELLFAAGPAPFTAGQAREQSLVVWLQLDAVSGWYVGVTDYPPLGGAVQVAVAATGPLSIAWGAAINGTATPVHAKAVTCGPFTTGLTAPPPALTPTLQWAMLLDDGPEVEPVTTQILCVDFEVQKQATDARFRYNDTGFGTPYAVGLYQHDIVLSHNRTLPQLTECDFPGYARILLTPPGVQTNNGQGLYKVVYPTCNFVCTGVTTGQTTAGWFLVNPADMRLRYMRRHANGPILVASVGQTVPVVPVFTWRSQYVEQ